MRPLSEEDREIVEKIGDRLAELLDQMDASDVPLLCVQRGGEQPTAFELVVRAIGELARGYGAVNLDRVRQYMIDRHSFREAVELDLMDDEYEKSEGN